MSAEESERESALSADRPLTDPALDRLGYGPFAELVAKAILGQSSTEGLVIGLYGAWGGGQDHHTQLYRSLSQEKQREDAARHPLVQSLVVLRPRGSGPRILSTTASRTRWPKVSFNRFARKAR